MSSQFEDWIVKLIRSVESKPALYNNAFKDRSDRQTVARCWTEVCKEVIPEWKCLRADEKEVKEKEIQQKWQNLRTSFRRELKAQRKVKCSKSGHKRRKYIHYDDMLFLLPYYENKPRFNETTVDEEDAEDESNFEDLTESFIKAVESKPALYNKNLKEYSDRYIAERLWYEVCEELVADWDSLSAAEKKLKAKEYQLKWRNLRTSFKRELKFQKSTNEVSYKRRKYIYFETLSFLLPYIDCNWTTTSELNAYEEDTWLVEEHEQDDFQFESSTNNKNEAKPSAKEASFEEILLDFPKEIDEDKSFLFSLVPTFKKMTQSQKMDAKIGILSVIKRVFQKTSNLSSIKSDIADDDEYLESSSNGFY